MEVIDSGLISKMSLIQATFVQQKSDDSIQNVSQRRIDVQRNAQKHLVMNIRMSF